MNCRCRMCALLIALLFFGSNRVSGASTTSPAINLTLGWTDNSDGEFGYIIERAPSSAGPWSMAGMTSPNKTEFLDKNLNTSTSYFYRVRVFGVEGVSEASNIAQITTPARALAPQIRKQPAQKTASLGEDALLAASIGGNPPLNFQWRCNGTNIIGATSPTLSLNSIQPQDAGFYSLAISNSLGGVVSLPAKLTVIAPVACFATPGGTMISVTNGQRLELGRGYKIGAVPQKGNVFQGWRINGTNGPVSRTLSFNMRAGLELSARFRDVTAPTLAAKNLKTGAKLSTPNFSLTGTAQDNMGVAKVSYQINNGPWLRAAGGTNWQAQLWLKPGMNSVRVLASDTSGNNSRTTTLAITSLGTNAVVMAVPVLNNIRVGNGAATISFPSVAGALYELEYHDAQFSSPWIPLESSLTLGNGGPLHLTDPAAPDDGRFYRVSVATLR